MSAVVLFACEGEKELKRGIFFQGLGVKILLENSVKLTGSDRLKANQNNGFSCSFENCRSKFEI
jgi:hypothetical protein